jgi:hypothetical protein
VDLHPALVVDVRVLLLRRRKELPGVQGHNGVGVQGL